MNKDLGIRIVDNNIIMNERDVLLVCNSTVAFNVKLPRASGSGIIYFLKNINTGTITVLPDCVDTVDYYTSLTLFQWDGASIIDYAVGKWLKL